MRLTPVDITHKTFKKKLLGFDSDEVNLFMQQIAEQMETLIHERNHLKEVLRDKELNLLEYKERDKVLTSTMTTATQMSETMRQEADREGKLVILDAQKKADTIVADAQDSLKKVYQEMTDLKKARVQFEANLRALAQAHLSLLEQSEKYMPQMSL